MRGERIGQPSPTESSDDVLWQRSREADAVWDETADFLDLAAYADGNLDSDEAERVAARLAVDPVAASDVAAARAAVEQVAAGPECEPLPEHLFVRAAALVTDAAVIGGNVVPFAPKASDRPVLRGMARWGSLVAAMAVASWLGFTLGMDTSMSLTSTLGGEDSFLPEMLDPSTGFLRDLTEGSQT